MKRAKRLSPGDAWAEIVLMLTDDQGIRPFNEAVFGRSGPTDVISLRYAPLPNEGGRNSGEVIVNVERADQEGRRRSRQRATWNVPRELALYIAHGCDHLAGEEDADEVSRRRMRRRELRWIREADADGLLAGLVT